MQCPVCDADVSPTSNFCPYCGHNVASSRPTHDVPESWETRDDQWEPEDETVALERGPEEAAPGPPRSTGPADETTTMDPIDGGSTRSSRAEAGQMRHCPRCGAANGPRRVRCGRCDADLRTGEAAATAHPEIRDEIDEVEPSEERGRGRRVALLLVLAALLGAAIGVWFLLQEDAAPESPQFDEGVYPGAPSELPVAAATASDTREPEEGRSFEAGNLVDGEPSTAWASTEGSAEATTVLVRLGGPAWVSRLSLHNGDQADQEAFERWGRAQRVLVRVGQSSFELHLLDVTGEQAVDLPGPVLTDRIEVEVLSVHDGADSVRISEVTPLGWVAVGADRTVLER